VENITYESNYRHSNPYPHAHIHAIRIPNSGIRHVPKYIYDPFERIWTRNPALPERDESGGAGEVQEALHSSSFMKISHTFDKHLVRRTAERRPLLGAGKVRTLVCMPLCMLFCAIICCKCVCIYIHALVHHFTSDIYIYIYIYTYIHTYIYGKRGT
jgi:hypothetical protein